VLVNAGRNDPPRRPNEFEPEGFLRVVDVNPDRDDADVPRLASRAEGGSIVNLASMLSFVGRGFAPAYSDSNGGVAQLTKSLAIAWAAQGIRAKRDRPGLDSDNSDPDAGRRLVAIGCDPSRGGRRRAAGSSPRTWAGAALFLCSSRGGRSSPEGRPGRSTADTPSLETKE